MIKYSVVVVTDDITRFVNCISRVIPSLGMRSELIVIWVGKESLTNTVESVLVDHCNSAHIPHTFVEHKYEGLSKAWHGGISITKGEYVALLTDRVLVSDGFLTKLVYCMENYTNSYKAEPVGVVVPVSDYAVARQQIVVPDEIHGVDAIQTYLSDAVSKKYGSQPPWLVAGQVSSFCMLMKKEVYDKVGKFPKFDTEFEAHSWFSNVLMAGYYVVIAGDVYVERIVEKKNKLFYGYESYTKDLTSIKRSTKIGFLHHVVVNTVYERDIFIKSLEKTTKLTDHVFVLDVNSKIGLKLYLKEKRPDLWEKITKYEKVVRPLDVSVDYNQLTDWARGAGMDWVFSIEGDEIIEDKVSKDLLQKLINPPNWSVLGYVCHIYTLWENESKYRIDHPWDKINEVRLVNLQPGWKIPSGGYRNAPMIPPEHVRASSIRLKCYGYVSADQRNLKLQSFHKMGIDKDPNHAGFAFYRSLVESFKAILYPWVEQNGVSVYAPVKGGSNLLVDDWIDQFWGFADQIVVGDDDMESKTKERLEQWGDVEFVPVTVKSNFGAARTEIIRHCSCDWIFSLDLDERFDHWGTLRRDTDHPYYDGYLFPIDNYRRLGKPFGSGTIRLYKNKDEVKYWGLLHESIDDFAREHGWHLHKTVAKIRHYGYVLGSTHEIFKKMQRYLEINLRQIKDYPKDGRAYYNLAMHLLEDGMMDEAVTLLKIASILKPKYGIPAEELSKFYVATAQQWASKALSFMSPETRSKHMVALHAQLTKMLPSYLPAAKGHAYTYFRVHKDDLKWLRSHCQEIVRALSKSPFV